MTAYQLVLVVLFAVLLLILVVLFLPTRGARARKGVPTARRAVGPIDRDDDRYWTAGVFYNNPDDPDPVVPKRYGWGWTINVGHPFGKVVLLIMFGMILLPVVLAIVDPGFAATGCHPSSCHLLP